MMMIMMTNTNTGFHRDSLRLLTMTHTHTHSFFWAGSVGPRRMVGLGLTSHPVVFELELELTWALIRLSPSETKSPCNHFPLSLFSD